MKKYLGILAVLALVVAPAMADMSYTFKRITTNAPNNFNLQSQLEVVVAKVAGAPQQVSFTFWNHSKIQSSITDIYFDEGTFAKGVPLSPLASFVSLKGSGDVSFTPPAKPGDLPGGGSVGFSTTANLSADSDCPVSQKGINPNESLTIVFALADGMGYTDVIADLRNGLLKPIESPWLRIGLHVQSIGTQGYSDSYVDAYEVVPISVNVPAPGAIVLGMLGLGLVGWFKGRNA